MIRSDLARSFVSISVGLFVGGGSHLYAQTFSNAGFASEQVTSLGAYGPISLTWAPDGRMFIWQKNGIVRIFKNGQLLSTPFLDFSSKVNTYNDNGMWGLAFDPGFATNRYVYLTYIYEPNGNPNDPSPKIARLVRVTASSSNPDVMQAGTEVALLDNLPNDYATHSIGTIRFAADGTMFVGNGDGASPYGVDANAFGAQQLDNVRGKLFRLNTDGTAPPDNPFYTDPNSVRSKVWAYGLRNPYRFSLHPTTGEPFLADVGWNDAEEIDRGTSGGNYGWPCYEGRAPQSGYQAAIPQCASVTEVIGPIISYTHSAGDLGQGGTCIVGGDFYSGNLYPQMFQGNYFYADYSGNWIHRLILDANGNVISNATFATGISGPTCVEQGPDGMLYYVAFNSGQIRRIRFNGPVAVANATPSYGYSPLPVSFSSAGSTNSAGGTLTYSWNFGDGTTSTQANPSHTYTAAGVTNFNAVLTVTGASNLTSSASVRITVGSQPPIPFIAAPTNNAGFMPGQIVSYQGSATDPDQGTLPGNSLQWTVLLHHNTHVHTEISNTGTQGSFVVENHGPVGSFYYEIVLIATDSSGLSASTNVNVTVLQDTVAPSTPTNLVATPLSGVQVRLNWSASSDNVAVARYEIERQSPGATNFVQIATPTDTTYNDSGLWPLTSYNYRVRAVDASGNPSPYSNVAGATTLSSVPSLVAAYSFNEGTGTIVADASGNGNTGTVSSATWTNAGKYGNALVFNGTSARITVNDAASLRLTTGMTLEAWIYPTSTANGWRDVIYKGNDNYYLEARSPSGPPAIGGSFAGNPLYGLTSLATGTWTHLAGTYDGAILRLYVNGTEVASRVQSGSIATSTNSLQIGGDSFFGQYFQGRIDEVRVYNRSLGATEIQSDMNTPITNSPTNTPPTISAIAAQTILEDTTTGPISFAVGDLETPAGNLTVSGVSSNQLLVSNSNISFGGSASNRTVTIVTAPDQNGTTLITLTVSDGALNSNTSFLVTVTPVNDPPTITPIADQTIDEDTQTAPLSFTVGDVETPPASLTVTGSSSNQALVPESSIHIGGGDSHRTVTVIPATNQNGTAWITLTVGDGELSTNTTFLLTVNPVNDPPTIASIGDQVIVQDTVAGPIDFMVDDIDDPVESLALSAVSSNQTLIPAANVVFGGTGSNRTVMVTPVSGQTGTTLIGVTVSDGAFGSTAYFNVTVLPAPALPPFAITSLTLDGNDAELVWNGRQGTNVIQFSSGDYTGAYLDLASIMISVNGVTNFTHAGGATNAPSGYYRIRLVQP
jgi:glucose/arabinose dehydrogenase